MLLFTHILIAFLIGSVRSQCLPGWIDPGSTSPLQACYLFINGGPWVDKTWSEARSICQGFSGELTVIKNAEERSFIESSTWSPGPVNEYYIGLRKDNSVWKWPDGSTETTHLNFPDSEQTQVGKDCAFIDSRRRTKSASCSSKKRFVCKRLKETPLTCNFADGWVYNTDYQLCYKFFQTGSHWENARQRCEENGGRMVFPNDASANTFLLNLKQTFGSDYYYFDTWLPIRTVKTSDTTYKWVFKSASGDQDFNYTNWETENTSMVDGVKTDHCAMQWFNGFWRAINCWNTNHHNGVMCQRPKGGCYPGWRLHANKCYYVSGIRKWSWDSASKYCSDRNTRLITISNETIQTFAARELKDFNANGIYNLWFGMRQPRQGGDFEWEIGGAGQYAKWANDEPFKGYNPGGCARMRSDDESGLWTAGVCSDLGGFICEAETDALVLPEKPIVPEAITCQAGAVQSGNKCYRQFTDLKTWSEASTFCQMLTGGSLAIALSKNDIAAINALIDNSAEMFWIGLKYNSDTKFDWVDGTPADIHNWEWKKGVGSESPVTPDMRGAHYGGKNRAKAYKWTTRVETEKKPFICRQDANVPYTTPSPDRPTRDPSSVLKCGLNWEDDQTGPYCYQFNNYPSTWMAAKLSCEAQGGFLSSISNRLEQALVAGRIRGLSGQLGFWIGYNKITSPGYTWRWTDPNFPVSFSAWDEDQPNSEAQSDCTAMVKSTGRWISRKCSSSYGYVCKKKGIMPTEPPATGPTMAPNSTTTTVPPGWQIRCMDDWFALDGKCYTVQKRQQWQGPIDHIQALQLCRNWIWQQSTLGSIRNEQINEQLTQKILAAGFNTSWIGLVDLFPMDRQAEFGWTDLSPVDYTNWMASEPDIGTLTARRPACARINTKEGKWELKFCESASAESYLCQAPPTLNPTTDPINVTIPSGCDLPYRIAFEGKCYFIMVTDLRQWDNALQECKTTGGTLASFEQLKENTFMGGELERRGINSPLWIGLNGNTSYLKSWTNGGQLTYTNWAGNGPQVQTRFCVNIGSTEHKSLWASEPCLKEFGYICEKRKTGVTRPPPQLTTRDPNFCPAETLEMGNDCFYTSIVNKTLGQYQHTWQAGLASCRVNGGDLASIDGPTSMRNISSYIKSKGGATTVWIGMSFSGNPPTFKWSDNSPVVYTYWLPGQPETEADTRLCVALVPETDAANSYAFTTANCEDQKYVLCRARKSSLTTTTVVTTTMDPSVVTKCGNDTRFRIRNDVCYYFENQQQLGYNAANRFCLSNGYGLLTTITSSDENAFVFGQVDKTFTRQAWIGLHNINLNGYEWQDKSPVSHLAWDNGEPDDKFGSQLCVSMDVKTGKWKASHCDSAYGFICKQSTYTPPPPAVGSGGCPPSFAPFHDKCFRIMFGKTPMPFSEALEYCQNYTIQFGMPDTDRKKFQLASVADSFENSFLTSYFLGRTITQLPIAYIGMVNVKEHGERDMRWLDNRPVTFTNWWFNEPSANMQSNKDCVAMDTRTGAIGRWVSSLCSTGLQAVCQINRSPQWPLVPFNLSQVSCPPKWVAFSGSCFFFSRTVDTWHGAQAQCNSFDVSQHNPNQQPNLVTVFNGYEQHLLNWMVEDPEFPLSGDLPTNYWIGLNSLEHEQEWKWVAGWPVGYSYWARGEPLKRFRCAAAAHRGRYSRDNGRWWATDCEAKLPFVCKLTWRPVPQPDWWPGSCPDGWLTSKTSCFYVDTLARETWATALVRCASMIITDNVRAELALIENPRDNILIEQEMIRQKERNGTRSLSVWLGFRVGPSGGIAAPGGGPISFTNWAPEQPDWSNGRFSGVSMVADGMWYVRRADVVLGLVCRAQKAFAPWTDPPTTISFPWENPNTPLPHTRVPPQADFDPGQTQSNGIWIILVAILVVLTIAILAIVVLVVLKRMGVVKESFLGYSGPDPLRNVTPHVTAAGSQVLNRLKSIPGVDRVSGLVGGMMSKFKSDDKSSVPPAPAASGFEPFSNPSDSSKKDVSTAAAATGASVGPTAGGQGFINPLAGEKTDL